MTPSQERLLGGRYELAGTIGVGGMAEVFLATDTRLGREVAVKVLRADLARDPTFHSRFRREAQAAASLNDPTIVSVYDTGEDPAEGGGVAVPWIVMEHVEGRTLRDAVDDDGRLLPARALEIVTDVLQALQVAHEAGIVHRDIKPGNVMLTRSGDVKVMDFGIARAASGAAHTATETSSVMGTAAYLSPEQARGEHVDARSDLYSTGCLLYELLTGGPPFTGDSPVAVAYQHVREDPVAPSRHDPSLSADMDAVVLKAMAKNPANRYQSAEEMAQDLRRAAAGTPVLATPLLVPGPVEGSVRRVPPGQVDSVDSRTRAIVYSALALLLLVLVAGVAYGADRLLSSGDTGLVAAPTVTGQSLSQAQSQLAGGGLTAGQVTPVFSGEPVGEVLTQVPAGGIFLDEGGAVDLTVSQGPENVVVPSIVGRSQAEATALLETVKLTVSPDVVERDGNIAPGQVLEIIPPAGSTRPAGSSVQLVVSSGQVEVPRVVGRSQAEAEQILQAAGLNVGVQLVDATGPAGVVLSQEPGGGGTAQRGTDVIIQVSQTPAPVVPTPAPTPTPSPTLTPTVPMNPP